MRKDTLPQGKHSNVVCFLACSCGYAGKTMQAKLEKAQIAHLIMDHVQKNHYSLGEDSHGAGLCQVTEETTDQGQYKISSAIFKVHAGIKSCR